MVKMLKIIREETNEEVLAMVANGPAGFRMYELLQQCVRYIAPDIVENGCTLHLVAYVIDVVLDCTLNGVRENLVDYTDKYRIKVTRHGINFDAEYYMSTGSCGKDHFILFI